MVHVSARPQNNREDVNILLSLPNHDSFTLTRIDIRAPAIGYTSPLGQGLVFVGWNPPTPEHTRAYDNVRSCEEYQQTLRQQINMVWRGMIVGEILLCLPLITHITPDCSTYASTSRFTTEGTA